MLGMYPLKPGVPEFVLTGSLYDRVKIKLNNGSEIHIHSSGDPWSVLENIIVDGKSLEDPFLNIDGIIENKGVITIEYEY